MSATDLTVYRCRRCQGIRFAPATSCLLCPPGTPGAVLDVAIPDSTVENFYRAWLPGALP